MGQVVLTHVAKVMEPGQVTMVGSTGNTISSNMMGVGMAGSTGSTTSINMMGVEHVEHFSSSKMAIGTQGIITIMA